MTDEKLLKDFSSMQNGDGSAIFEVILENTILFPEGGGQVIFAVICSTEHIWAWAGLLCWNDFLILWITQFLAR